ncbi:MAG: transporter substrate-binding domain-containing protein [Acetobacteraceae bacterium]|nr:transporter substrate-binding domain-containing protein [Acetobacteraceae bacterium]
MIRPFLRAAALTLALPGLAAAQPAATAAQSPTLADVRQRGELRCGVDGELPGFSAPDPQGVMRGLDANTCTAVAAAVLDDVSRVRFVPQPAVEAGLDALARREIEVLARNATITLSRDAGRTVSPAAVTFFDGMGFLVPQRLGVASPRAMQGGTVCWAGAEGAGTAGENLAGFSARFQLGWTLRHETQPLAVAALREGRCDALAADSSALNVRRILDLPVPEEWVVLPEIVSREPLAPYVRSGDDGWRALVAWVHHALLEAEYFGVTSANALQSLGHEDWRVRRLLGAQPGIGGPMGLPDEWALRAILAVGDYGEMFERNLGARSVFRMDRGLNDLFTRGGLQVPFPTR